MRSKFERRFGIALTLKLCIDRSKSPRFSQIYLLANETQQVSSKVVDETSVGMELEDSDKKGPIVVTPLHHPVLKSLDPLEAVNFVRDRLFYEIQFADKHFEGSAVQPASYRASVDPQVLRAAQAIGGFDQIAPGIAPESLNEEQIKSFIKVLAQDGNEKEPDVHLIESTLKGLRTNMKITNPRNRMYQLSLDYDKRMASIGFEKFREVNPKKAIKHLLSAVHPRALQLEMENTLEYSPHLKEDWKQFITYLANTAVTVQRGMDTVEREKRATESTRNKNESNSHRSKDRKEHSKKGKHNSSDDDSGRMQ